MKDLESNGSEEVSFGEVFRAILKGKWLILISTAISLAGCAAYLSVTKPVYEATGTIRIDPSRSGSLGLTDMLLGGNSDVIPTEIGILGSDQVALSAMQTLTPEQFQHFAGFPYSQMVFRLQDEQGRPLHLNGQQEGAIQAFKSSLKAATVPNTQLVNITFRNHDPELAALLINRAVDAYLRQSFDSRYNSVAQVRGWMQSQMQDLQKKAAEAQQKLAQFQEQNDLIGTDTTNNSVMDSLRMLNSRVTLAEGDRIVKEAQLRAAISGDPSVLVSLLPDPHLNALQQTEAQLYTQETQLATKFGPSYPPLMEVRAQLKNVQDEIARNIGVITAHLKQDFQASQQAENMLRQEYNGEMTRAYGLNRKQADYAVLLAEGTSSRELYDQLQFKLQQAIVNSGLDSINTMIVDHARAPLVPVEPKKTLILISGLILGLAVGIGAALIMGAMSSEVQTVSQLESSSKLANLATVPHMEWPEGLSAETVSPGSNSRLIALREPRSRPAESYRTMRNSILLSSIDHPPKLTLIASSLPGEGKSSTAANYAVALAQNGAKVLLLDADLRRPTQHRIFGVSNTNGLSEHILDRAGSEEIQQPIATLPNLYLIPAGENTAFPSEALASGKMHSLLERWETEYDAVVVDSAPLLTVSDSLPLATLADVVVLVVRAGVTPLKALMRAKAILLRAHARIAGTVLNDLSNPGEDSGYYGKDGYGYYN